MMCLFVKDLRLTAAKGKHASEHRNEKDSSTVSNGVSAAAESCTVSK